MKLRVGASSKTVLIRGGAVFLSEAFVIDRGGHLM